MPRDPFLDKLLRYYGLTPEAYESEIAAPTARLSLPSYPFSESGKRALERVKTAIENGEKILCYGDYDVDGISATAIAVGALKELGAKVKGYLPSRYSDGYGLSVKRLSAIKETGYGLIITLDNGIAANEAISKAKELGIETVVIDHHERGEVLPPAYGIVHAMLDGFGEYPISAGVTSYYFFKSLLGHDDPFYLSLAALSTLSDQMPLRSYNRHLLRLGLEAINEHGFKEYSLLAGHEVLGYDDLQFKVIPTLNALGRLKGNRELLLALRYFDKEGKDKEKIASYLLKNNEEKKRLLQGFSFPEGLKEKRAIALLSSLPEGLGGLLASRLLGDYGVPTAVFSVEEREENVYVASLRAPDGYDLMEILGDCPVELLTYGGHKGAAGVSIRKEDFPAFQNFYEEAAAKYPRKREEKKAIPINFAEVCVNNASTLSTFAPFGKDFEEPPFELPPLEPDGLLYAKDGKYLSMGLPGGGRLFSFKLGERQLQGNDQVILSGKLKIDEFRGQKRACLYAEEVRKSHPTYL